MKLVCSYRRSVNSLSCELDSQKLLSKLKERLRFGTLFWITGKAILRCGHWLRGRGSGVDCLVLFSYSQLVGYKCLISPASWTRRFQTWDETYLEKLVRRELWGCFIRWSEEVGKKSDFFRVWVSLFVTAFQCRRYFFFFQSFGILEEIHWRPCSC